MSITTQELAADKWVQYFDALAPSVEGLLVTIEVMSEQLGDQLDVERLPLQAIGYDHNDNVLEVAVGGRGHATRSYCGTSSQDPRRSASRSPLARPRARFSSLTRAVTAR